MTKRKRKEERKKLLEKYGGSLEEFEHLKDLVDYSNKQSKTDFDLAKEDNVAPI
jgi:hypothetical protein